MATMQKITPHLWFAKEAEQAVQFYTGIFKNSKIGKISHYTEVGKETHGMEAGTVMTIEFWLEDQQFTALNGGPIFTFNESVSFIVHCKDQEEIDYYWDKLRVGGDERSQVCGWLKDQFGLSWQIVPDILPELWNDADPERSGRVMAALLKMKKLDIAALQAAFDGK